MVKSWSEVVQVGKKFVERWSKVGQKMVKGQVVKFVKSLSKVGQFGHIAFWFVNSG